jgi:hypothetical protein
MTSFLETIVSFIVGGAFGILLVALTTMTKRSSQQEDQETDLADDARFHYLEMSECNLMFNPQFNLWALIDANNKPVAAGTTPRAAIDRARELDRAESPAEEGVPA